MSTTKLRITVQNAEDGVVLGGLGAHSMSWAMSPFDRAYSTLIETVRYLIAYRFEL